ncbi:hypothetical protein J2T04_000389 [Chryseobacterium lathyri]|uniref:Uncharacterized protein n=1 Tax=Chryseobacterium lathyri TaxID=395933 RepID=A0ABT9SGH8_9FLAO|nr:hypothetical protein [Chryseobacterium lathyri]
MLKINLVYCKSTSKSGICKMTEKIISFYDKIALYLAANKI